MNANLAAVLYLVAGVLFILSLRGLSSPASSRQGNFFGMIGMAIAVATTSPAIRRLTAWHGCWSCSASPSAARSVRSSPAGCR
jgi:NAD/NADP transhydrogenase beta subunit